MSFVSRKEAAAALGFTRQRLETLIKQGRIVETDAGVDLDQAQAVRATMNSAARLVVSQASAPEAPAASDAAGSAPARKPYATARGSKKVSDPETGALFDFADARTRREHANAQLAVLRYQEMSGKLIPADEVKAKEFAVARKLRDRILGWPARVAQIVPPEAMKIITDECDALVRELQEDAAQIAERTA